MDEKNKGEQLFWNERLKEADPLFHSYQQKRFESERANSYERT